MGEIADTVNEEGADAWLQHLAGECDGPCPYCASEDEAAMEEDETP